MPGIALFIFMDLPSWPTLLLNLLSLGWLSTFVRPAWRDAAKTGRRWLYGVLVGLCLQPGLAAHLMGRIPWPSLLLAMGAWLALTGWTLYAHRGELHIASKPTHTAKKENTHVS